MNVDKSHTIVLTQKKTAHPGRYVFYIFLIALALRLFFFSLVRDYPLLYFQSLDENFYLDRGKTIAENFFGGEPGHFFMDPLYGYFLGAIFFIFGDHLTIVRIVQILLDAFNIVIIFAIGRKVWDQQAGLIAAFIWATYTVSFYYSLLILKVTLAVTGMLVFTFLILKVIENQRAIGFFLIGMAAGILVYIRANFILVIPLTIMFYFFIERSTWRIRIINCGIFLAGAMVLLSLNAIRNYAMIGHPEILITSGGRMLYCCNNPENTSGLFDVPSFSRSHPVESEKDFHMEAERRLDRALSPREVSEYWRNETFNVMREHPRIIPVLIANKVKWAAANYEIPMNQSYQLVAEFAGSDKWPLPNYAFVFAFGLPGLVIGLFRQKQAWWLMVPILTILATLMIFCVSSRFRMPMVPFLIIGTGIFLRCAWLWIKEGKWIKIVLPGLVSITLFLISMMISPAESDGYKEFGLAKAFYLQNDYNKAKTIALDALRKDPKNVDVYILLGRIARTEGRTGLSMEYYRKAMAINTENFTVNYDLGMLYMNAGEPEYAIPLLEKSLSIKRYTVGMLNLAQAYEATGDKAEAMKYYNEFIKSVEPDDPRYEFAQNRISDIRQMLD